ncbi:LacI family DNA-binding transcriptional regulator [Flavicella sp.]|uniref:LacI family DNA-binding transcriptional regulator n=1 Tax=Flavicella sp. TaxID=2957742 RepID=UPI00301769B4
MITIKEIAILAQVSSDTDDRVIHKRSGVSKKTADKVNRLLNESNFTELVI